MISADHEPLSTKSPAAAACQAAAHVKLLGFVPAMHVELRSSLLLTAMPDVIEHAVPHAHLGAASMDSCKTIVDIAK